MIPRDSSIYIGKNTIWFWCEIGFEYGFIGILSNECFWNGEKLLIMPGKHWDFYVVSGSDGCGGTWMVEWYRLIWRIYLSWERWVWDFGVIFGAIFVEWEWKMIGKNWDFTIRWSIRWESGGECELVGIYWDRCIFQSVWRLTCLCCWADPGSLPGLKVPPSLIFHDF